MQTPALVALLAATLSPLATWLVVKLPFVREWRARRWTRRTTRATWARHPETRPVPAYEHPPAALSSGRCGWAMPPTTRMPVGEVVGGRGGAPCR